MQKLIKFTLVFSLFLFCSVSFAQTSSFTYQGKLNDGGSPANGQYDLSFKLFDLDTGGTELGTQNVIENVQVTNGIFTVELNFNFTPFNTVAAGWVEVGVRPGASTGAFTTLSPRQHLTSAPYAMQSAFSDFSNTAGNSNAVGGVPAAQIVNTSDARLTDARVPLPNSPNYVQNTTSTQTSSNFNVSGVGRAGTLRSATIDSLGEFQMFGDRILKGQGNNLAVGTTTGDPSAGLLNTYVGANAGTASNSNAEQNTFVGALSAPNNTTGQQNSFFGARSGISNTLGNRNTFSGTGSGVFNDSGSDNSFFGVDAGQSNSIGNGNSFFGAFATGAGSVFNSGAFGFRSFVTQNNSIVLGSVSGQNGATVTQNVGIGTTAPSTRFHVVGNSTLDGNMSVTGTLNASDASLSNLNAGNMSVTGTLNASGAALSNLNAGNITTGTLSNARLGVVPVANGGTGSATQNFVDLSTNQNAIAGDKTFTGNVGVSGPGGVFNGNGSGLTDLNGANIQSGTIDASALAPESFPANHNLSLLATLRWDLLKKNIAFPLGTRMAAFDGTHVWVSYLSSLRKIRASDGAIIGDFGCGLACWGVAFDGTYIWATSFTANTLTKLRASDGVSMGSFAVGSAPTEVAFDGSSVWVVNTTGTSVSKLRTSDGASLGTFTTVGAPAGVAFDGIYIWVTNSSTDNVTKFFLNGSVFATYPVGSSPAGVAFDGENIWVANFNGGTVTKLRPADGASLATYTVGSGPTKIAFDGKNIWVVNRTGGTLIKLRPSDGVILGTYIMTGMPNSVTFDGANVWVTNFGTNSIDKIPVFQ